MNVPRLKGLAASAVALATVAFPLQAMAAPHFRGDRPGQARCDQMQKVDGQFKWLARQYPQLEQWLLQCRGVAGPATPFPTQPTPYAPVPTPQQPASQLVSFNDLGGFSWATSDINLLQSMGIMQGVGRNLFQPAGTLSRVQFAALLQRVFHLTVPSSPIAFIDVSSGYWGYNAVEAAAPYMGEFNTPGGVAFEPNLPILRIDVAATIGKILVTEGLAQLPTTAAAQSVWGGFADGSLVPAGLSQYAAVAVQAGIMQGMGNGSFGVDDTLNRAQAAVLLVRVLEGTETMPGGTSTVTTTSSIQGTFSSATGTSIDITVNGSTAQFTLASTGVTVTLNGMASSLSNLTAGDAVTLTLNASNDVIAVTASGSSTSVSTLTGTVASISGSTLYLTVGTTTVELTIAAGVTLDVTQGETVTVSLNSSGQVVAATGTPGTSTSSATGIIQIVNASQIELDVNGSYTTYNVATGATATLNGQAVAITSLAAGETATVTIDTATNQVTSIAATGTATSTSSATGIIQIVNASQIELDVNGSYTTYNIATGATATLNGQAVAITSLAAGETATVTIDTATNQVTSIAATGTATSNSETGTVLSVNTTNSTITLSIAGSAVTLPVAAGATVTINGQSSSLGNVAANETATVTIVNGQVTAISVSAPTVASTVTGYIVSTSATTVAVAVYGSSGATESTYTVDAGAPITLNGSQSAVTSLPLGDQATVGLDSSGGAASISATTPSGQVTGELVGTPSIDALVLVNGTLRSVALGSAPVAFSGGGQVAVSALPVDTTITIDPSAMNGSALLVH